MEVSGIKVYTSGRLQDPLALKTPCDKLDEVLDEYFNTHLILLSILVLQEWSGSELPRLSFTTES